MPGRASGAVDHGARLRERAREPRPDARADAERACPRDADPNDSTDAATILESQCQSRHSVVFRVGVAANESDGRAVSARRSTSVADPVRVRLCRDQRYAVGEPFEWDGVAIREPGIIRCADALAYTGSRVSTPGTERVLD
jgi:hypothetical protein